MPGLHTIGFHPAVAIPLIAGLLFGPAEGFIVGAAGSMIAGLLIDGGISWNWDLGYGVMGLVAGLPLWARPSPFGGGQGGGLVGAGFVIIASAIAITAGIGFAALSDVLVASLPVDAAIDREWFAAARWDLLWGVPLALIALVGYRLLAQRREQR